MRDYDKKYLDYTLHINPCICGCFPKINCERVTAGHGEFPLYAWIECECGYCSKRFIVDGFYGKTTTVDDCIRSWNDLMSR